MATSDYTAADLASVKAAILALGTGTRKVKATIAGNTMEYGQVSLPALRELRQEIQAELNEAADTSNDYCYITTDKGF